MSYWVLVRQLDSRAQEEMTDNLGKIDHVLVDTESSTGRPWQHSLSDTILGHDNLSITVVNDTAKSPILSIGRFASAPEQLDLVNKDSDFLEWTAKEDVLMLTGRKHIQVPGLPQMTVLLSQDRSADQQLGYRERSIVRSTR